MNVGDICYCDPRRFPFGRGGTGILPADSPPVRVQILQQLSSGYYVGVTRDGGSFDHRDPRRTEFFVLPQFLSVDPAAFAPPREVAGRSSTSPRVAPSVSQGVLFG